MLKELEARKSAATVGKRVAKPAGPKLYTVADLFRDWHASPRFSGGQTQEGRKRRKPLAPKTIQFYRQNARVLEDFDPELWVSPVAALTPVVLDGLYDALDEAKGASVARATMATLRAALSFGQRKGRVAHNPAKGLGIGQAEARIRVGTIPEMQALVAAADAIGKPEIGDIILLGLFTGQRQGDRLQIEGGDMVDGRLFFRQNKTGAVAIVPPAPALLTRLAEARERRKEEKVRWPQVVIDEERQRPFSDPSRYGKVFRQVRAAAVAGEEEKDRPPCPSLADFRDQDLRDTAVTWLANSGCTVPEICSITGHTEQSAYGILKHYLGQDPERAAAAIGKLVAWLEKKGARL
ncbi:tyrosine-type recombinase/integrase [Faunimonas pinastri]|uniref:tyrosine-type recombinase/integrase n=1 Tax=Faunimonas pinastri TaxID=1855383 RepID=UPI000B812815|nr:tyrosine-type recombinase/integrase [Faunimonas pinastri]